MTYGDSSEPLMRSRRFLPLFITQFFTAFNDNFYKNALIALLTYGALNSDPADDWMRTQGVMLGGILFVLPYFLFSASAGMLADRFEKTRIVRIIKLLEIVMMAMGAVAFYNRMYVLLFIVVFLMGTHSAFFSPIKYGILPTYLKPNEMVAGNAYVEAATFAAIVMGTVFGTQLVLWPEVGVHLTAFVLLATALLGYIACLYMPPAPPVHASVGPVRFTPLRDTIDMLRAMPSYPESFRYILANTWFWVVSLAMMSIFPLYVSDVLGMDSDVYTLLLTIFAFGVGIGSVACVPLLKPTVSARYTPAAAVGMGLGSFGLAHYSYPLYEGAGHGSLALFLQTPEAPVIAGLMFFISFCGGLYAVPFFTLLQNSAPDDKKAFMFGANNIINAGGMTFSVLLIAVAKFFQVGIDNIFTAISLLCCLGATVLYKFILGRDARGN